jgi:type III pantothenate kinase
MLRNLLAVDIGNSSTKLGLFARTAEGLPQPEWTRLLEASTDLPDDVVADFPAKVNWRVASVQRESERRLAEWVRQHRPQDDYHLLSYRDLPIEVRVDQPERVGIDRLAAAVAVNSLRDPERPAVVIGAGSALVVNLIAADGAFEGGAILPGFRMSARALAGADLLPEVLFQSSGEPPAVLGKNTEAAIRSGLFWGAVGAVREIIERYAEEHRRPQVFVTGGDLQRLAPLVSAEAQFVPNLVLAGIAIAAEG